MFVILPSRSSWTPSAQVSNDGWMRSPSPLLRLWYGHCVLSQALFPSLHSLSSQTPSAMLHAVTRCTLTSTTFLAVHTRIYEVLTIRQDLPEQFDQTQYLETMSRLHDALMRIWTTLVSIMSRTAAFQCEKMRVQSQVDLANHWQALVRSGTKVIDFSRRIGHRSPYAPSSSLCCRQG